MSLTALTKPWEAMSYGFLDGSAKRELRRKMLKSVAVPGCQMPYASREVPMARGWGTGGSAATWEGGCKSSGRGTAMPENWCQFVAWAKTKTQGHISGLHRGTGQHKVTDTGKTHRCF